MFGRNKIAIVVAEFLGTFSLAGAMLAMLGRTTFPFFAAVAAGATFGLMTLVIGTTSGAHVNPALTFGMWTRRKIETRRALIYIAAQMFGGLVAWKLVEYLLNSPLQSIAGDRFMWRVLIAECMGAFIFAFGLSSAISQGYKGLRYAVTAGSSLTLGILIASFAGNGLLNPAVALAVKSWNVAYVVGPIIGVTSGMNIYAWLFATEVMSPVKVVANANSGRSMLRQKGKPVKRPANQKRT